MDKHAWDLMARRHPFLQPLHQCRRLKSLLSNLSLAVGRDGRNRYTFFPFCAETGRNTWKAGEFILAQPAFLRGLVQPPPGKALAYLDYAQQEFAVAAVLSGDERMMEAYRADDPYLAFGKQAGLIPPHSTKETHGPERKKLKACVLGLQYLISEFGLANQLDIQTDYAKALIAAHQRVYQRFWQWTDAVVDRAILDGFQETLSGWRIVIRDGEVLRQGRQSRRFNPRAAVNFPVHAGQRT
jgi:DNA polymerase I-like protein with 3'-5' exonuclease and polymerase domains